MTHPAGRDALDHAAAPAARSRREGGLADAPVAALRIAGTPRPARRNPTGPLRQDQCVALETICHGPAEYTVTIHEASAREIRGVAGVKSQAIGRRGGRNERLHGPRGRSDRQFARRQLLRRKNASRAQQHGRRIRCCGRKGSASRGSTTLHRSNISPSDPATVQTLFEQNQPVGAAGYVWPLHGERKPLIECKHPGIPVIAGDDVTA